MNTTEATTEPRPAHKKWRWLMRDLIDRFADAPAQTLSEIERAHIFQTLRKTEGSITLAAKSLGIDRKTLYVRLRRYSVEAAG
jgi:transcriptional regulator of acetoin/glycerol metabolism